MTTITTGEVVGMTGDDEGLTGTSVDGGGVAVGIAADVAVAGTKVAVGTGVTVGMTVVPALLCPDS